MKINKNLFPSTLTLFHIISSTFITLVEYFQITGHYGHLYLTVNLTLIWLTLIPYLVFKKNPESTFASAFIMIAYTAFCWWSMNFRPLYELAFFQGFVCMGFLRPKIKWLYPVLTVNAGLGIIALKLLPNPFGIKVAEPGNFDWITVITVFTFLGILVHTLYARERNFREEAIVRFGFIGRQTVQVAHDLKGLLQGPLTYIDYLKERIPAESEDIVQSLKYMEEDLDKLATMVIQLNKMAIGEDHTKWISLSKVIKSNQAILARRLKNVDLHLDLPVEIYGRESKINNIFFNLLLNSIESFQRKTVSDPKIQIMFDGQNVFYADNGEEDISAVLAGIENGRVPSSKENGGLGLIFIREDLNAIDARVEFLDCQPGLGVRVRFSKTRPLS